MGKEPSLQGELYTAYSQVHYEALAERASLLYSGRKFSADLLYSYSYSRERRETDKEAVSYTHLPELALPFRTKSCQKKGIVR